MGKIPEILARFVEKRPWSIILIVILLSGAAVPGLMSLKTGSGMNTFISSDAPVAQDNARYEQKFGSTPITIMLTGDWDTILAASNLAILTQLDQEIAQDSGHYRSSLSPASVLNAAVAQAQAAQQAAQTQSQEAQAQAAQQARQAAAAQGMDTVAQEAAAQQARQQVAQQFAAQMQQYAQIGPLALDNPNFIASVLYSADGSLNPALAPLFPAVSHALVVVTPQGNLSDTEALAAAQKIDAYFATHPLTGVQTAVVSSSLMLDAISQRITSDMALLLGLSIVAMVIILLVLFQVRYRWRLLSLLMVGIGALWTFGLMGFIPIQISMATMAALPILIGLGIDYSIQFHNRYHEEVSRTGVVGQAVVTSVVRMAPVVGVALIATIIGFITLYISSVPMIRDFGVILTIGIFLSYLVGLCLLFAIVYLGDRRSQPARLKKPPAEANGRIENILTRVGRATINRPLVILPIVVALGIAGGFADTWLPVNTNYEAMVPQDIPQIEQARYLGQITGGAGLTYVLEGNDITRQENLVWLKSFGDQELAHHSELTKVSSAATLVSATTGGVIPDQAGIAEVLQHTSPQYTASLISADGQMATITFQTKTMNLEETKQLLQTVARDAVPPAGTRFTAVGSTAMEMAITDSVMGSRYLMDGICLGAVFVILLLIYRRPLQSLFMVIPVVLVILWTSLGMWGLGIPLNPMTAILGVVVIGIGTEFMVLLLGRYEEEKKKGEAPRQAMIIALARIGRAIVATALATLGGFGVLIASNFNIIRDFGIATVLGISLCLIAALIVMPPLVVWIDEIRGRRKIIPTTLPPRSGNMIK
jgi:hydrophobe/amphiphile efflux-3 (HAE3) family protein